MNRFLSEPKQVALQTMLQRRKKFASLQTKAHFCFQM